MSQAAPGAPVDLSLTTSAVPLLDGLFQAEGAGAIPVLAVTVRAQDGGRVPWHTFSDLTVSSFAETRSGRLSGTVTLVVRR
jgi:hypothetical protein